MVWEDTSIVQAGAGERSHRLSCNATLQVHDDDPPAPESTKEESSDVAALDTKLLAMAEVLGYSRDKLDKHIQSSRSMYMSPEVVSPR